MSSVPQTRRRRKPAAVPPAPAAGGDTPAVGVQSPDVINWLASANEKLRRAGNHRRGVAWWAQTITVLTTIAETAGRMARHPDFTDVFNVEELSRFSARLWDTVTELTNNTPALADLELIDPIEKGGDE